MDSVVFPLSPLDHIMPRIHIFRLFYFSRSNTKDPLIIASTLKEGFHSLIQTLPLLAGTVNHLHSTKQRGRLAITAPFHSVDELFQVKDLTSHPLSYNDLRLSGFPVNDFRFEDILTIATERGNVYGVEKPVMLAQVNFLDGGFVLGVGMHHSVLDGTASVLIMRAWATACRGEDVGTLVEPALVDRGRLLQNPEKEATLDGIPEFVDHASEKKKKEQNHPTRTTSSSAYHRWLWQKLGSFLLQLPLLLPPLYRIFPRLFIHPSPSPSIPLTMYHFPLSTLSKLKSQLSPPPPQWISTNDALSAFLFCCIITARHPHPPDPSSTIPLAINLNGRAHFSPPLPPKYIGNATTHAQISASYAELRPSMANMATLALRLRQRIIEVSNPTYAEGFLEALHGAEDISAVRAGFGAGGMLVVPMQGQDFYGIDWGDLGGAGLGRCERRRAAREWGLREGICQIYPRLEGKGEEAEGEGELEVFMGLGREATERLRGMEVWRRWATWRCD